MEYIKKKIVLTTGCLNLNSIYWNNFYDITNYCKYFCTFSSSKRNNFSYLIKLCFLNDIMSTCRKQGGILKFAQD